ncbi:hypothetical protein B0T16DRAFT_99568 [Cercophora newfieldiana]|uniref:Uncharacterized protein n=1 Tax=Cercophora newfieldiana TaxID=92897 RepID=A0AA39YHY5_9PEZI|nr:hypothetical protein B0T16DRAFT_99568 [Cercophora newfieldiana]
MVSVLRCADRVMSHVWWARSRLMMCLLHGVDGSRVSQRACVVSVMAALLRYQFKVLSIAVVCDQCLRRHEQSWYKGGHRSMLVIHSSLRMAARHRQLQSPSGRGVGHVSEWGKSSPNHVLDKVGCERIDEVWKGDVCSVSDV